jgi:enoyl-CoA hydratase/3-hydroxyacyl-CoA dehydrogenase
MGRALQTATKKVRGVTDQGFPKPHLKMVGVLGGGLMGSGIATSLAISGAQVLLKEINSQFMQAGLDRVKANIGSMVKKGRMTQEQGAAVVARVKGCLDFSDFPRCDMVRLRA